MSALQPAHSSWIAFHGYANGTMTLITKTGESYAATIPESRYTDFVKSPSPGSFFNLYIKPFATVTKVDVTEGVALVEKAKVAVAAATPSTVTAPKKARKAPAKSLLPTKPWNGGDSAWIDFRCIADPTTGAGLVKALKRYISLGKADKRLASYLPYTALAMARPHAVGIAALSDWGTGYVDRKYLKAFPESIGDPGALAAAYRSAYRSWVRRQEAKKAKAASEPVKGMVYVHKASVMPSNPAVQVVTVPVGVTRDRVDMALRALRALEAGTVTMQVSGIGARVYVWDGRDLIGFYNMRTTTN